MRPVALITLILTSTATPPLAAEDVSTSTDHRVIAWNDMAEKFVKERLKDPDSAKFKAYFTRGQMGVPAICGTVSARNSFGGYGEPKRFISAGRREYTFLEGDVDDWPSLWDQMCLE